MDQFQLKIRGKLPRHQDDGPADQSKLAGELIEQGAGHFIEALKERGFEVEGATLAVESGESIDLLAKDTHAAPDGFEANPLYNKTGEEATQPAMSKPAPESSPPA